MLNTYDKNSDDKIDILDKLDENHKKVLDKMCDFNEKKGIDSCEVYECAI